MERVFSIGQLIKIAIYLGCELNGTETAEGYTPLDYVLYRNPGLN
jgi:hypothetical protein